MRGNKSRQRQWEEKMIKMDNSKVDKLKINVDGAISAFNENVGFRDVIRVKRVML